MIDLKLFCSDNERFDEPFSDTQYTYATNGVIIIRLILIKSITKPVPEFLKGLYDLPWEVEANIEWESLPRVEFELINCPDCEGNGRVLECPECNGVGEIEFDSSHNTYTNKCETCEGEGYLPPIEKRKDLSAEQAGKICHECKGKGKIPSGFSIPWHNRLISKNNYYLLQENLENIELALCRDELDPIRFRFTGGDGLLMPLRK